MLTAFYSLKGAKMKRKFVTFAGIVLVFAFFVHLTGCSQTDDMGEHTDINMEQTEWNREELDENLIADFKSESSSVAEGCVYECEMTGMSVTDIKEVFFPMDTSEFEITQQYVDPEDTKFGYTQILQTKNELEILSNYSGSMAETKEAKYYRNFLSCDANAWDNGIPTNLGSDKELDFLNKEQIKQEIQNGLERLIPNINVLNVNFYRLSSDYLNKLQNDELERLKQEGDLEWYEREKEYAKDWKMEQSAYYITVYLSINEIPIYDEIAYRTSDEKRLEGCIATFIYNRNGCVFVELPIFWETISQENKELISVGQALSELKKDMTSIISMFKFIMCKHILKKIMKI